MHQMYQLQDNMWHRQLSKELKDAIHSKLQQPGHMGRCTTAKKPSMAREGVSIRWQKQLPGPAPATVAAQQMGCSPLQTSAWEHTCCTPISASE